VIAVFYEEKEEISNNSTNIFARQVLVLYIRFAHAYVFYEEISEISMWWRRKFGVEHCRSMVMWLAGIFLAEGVVSLVLISVAMRSRRSMCVSSIRKRVAMDAVGCFGYPTKAFQEYLNPGPAPEQEAIGSMVMESQ